MKPVRALPAFAALLLGAGVLVGPGSTADAAESAPPVVSVVASRLVAAEAAEPEAKSSRTWINHVVVPKET